MERPWPAWPSEANGYTPRVLAENGRFRCRRGCRTPQEVRGQLRGQKDKIRHKGGFCIDKVLHQ